MTVVYQQDEARKYTANEVLYVKRELVDAVVRAALVGQTEAFIDMLSDGCEPAERITRASINETLKGVKESTQEFLNDVIADFAQSLEQRLNEVNYGAAVTGIKYNLAGEVTDIEVDISIS